MKRQINYLEGLRSALFIMIRLKLMQMQLIGIDTFELYNTTINKGVMNMPWNMQDYPDSLKNFDPLLRKKIIDIANALEDSGYEDDRAIPIAINEGKEWYKNASQSELDEFDQESNPSKTDEHDTSSANPELLDNDVEVYYEDDQWKVKTVDAKRASEIFDKKTDALERAKEIIDNRDAEVISYNKDGKKQD